MSRPTTPPPLSAKDPSCFAYPTMKDRIPVILSKIVDQLNRNRTSIAKSYGGEPAREELKAIIGAISQLRHEVMTNKPAARIRDSLPDSQKWNSELEKEVEKMDGSPMAFFDSAWLWMECYVYRRVTEAAAMCKLLRNFDVFSFQKDDSFTNAYKPLSHLTSYLTEVVHEFQGKVPHETVQEKFTEFLQMALWGNKCDLSISSGHVADLEHNPLEQLQTLKPKILIDGTDAAFQALVDVPKQDNGRLARVDIVLDNAGFELITDLCLAEYLVASGLASCVHFHAKAMPWFVSDVTERDWNWTLDSMAAINHISINKTHQRWRSLIQDGTFVFNVNDFWTLPNTFCEMKELCPSLFSDLCQSDFLIFKGDLNYRKLVSDRQWDPTTDFVQALRGFRPAPFVSLRTLKCDCVVGLEPGQAERTEKVDPQWMISGNWAVVSVCKERD